MGKDKLDLFSGMQCTHLLSFSLRHCDSALGTGSVSQILATWRRSAARVASLTPSGFPWARAAGRGRHTACSSSTGGSSRPCNQRWHCSDCASCKPRPVSAARYGSKTWSEFVDNSHEMANRQLKHLAGQTYVYRHNFDLKPVLKQCHNLDGKMVTVLATTLPTILDNVRPSPVNFDTKSSTHFVRIRCSGSGC